MRGYSNGLCSKFSSLDNLSEPKLALALHPAIELGQERSLTKINAALIPTASKLTAVKRLNFPISAGGVNIPRIQSEAFETVYPFSSAFPFPR